MFYDQKSSKSEIASAGNTIFTKMFKGEGEDLKKLRYLTYMHLVATSKGIVKPEKLPPTKTAAKFHTCWVYLQLSQWLSFNNSETS